MKWRLAGWSALVALMSALAYASQLSSGPPQYAAVELNGLATLQPAQVWRLAGGMPQPPIEAPHLAAMLFRLAGSGLFSAVSVATRVEEDEGRALVSLEEVPAIRSIVRDAARENNRFSAIVMGVVRSPQFQMRVKADQARSD